MSYCRASDCQRFFPVFLNYSHVTTELRQISYSSVSLERVGSKLCFLLARLLHKLALNSTGLSCPPPFVEKYKQEAEGVTKYHRGVINAECSIVTTRWKIKGLIKSLIQHDTDTLVLKL